VGGREWREREEGRRGNGWLIKESRVDFVTGGEELLLGRPHRSLRR